MEYIKYQNCHKYDKFVDWTTSVELIIRLFGILFKNCNLLKCSKFKAGTILYSTCNFNIIITINETFQHTKIAVGHFAVLTINITLQSTIQYKSVKIIAMQSSQIQMLRVYYQINFKNMIFFMKSVYVMWYMLYNVEKQNYIKKRLKNVKTTANFGICNFFTKNSIQPDSFSISLWRSAYYWR